MNICRQTCQGVCRWSAAVALLLLAAPPISGEGPTARHTLNGSSPTGFWKSVAFSPDGKILAAAVGKEKERGGPTVVRLWDVASGKNTATLEAGTGEMWSVAFSSDGKTLAVAGEGGPARLWDVATAETTATLK